MRASKPTVVVEPQSMSLLQDLAFDATAVVEHAVGLMRREIKHALSESGIEIDLATNLLGQIKLIKGANSVAMSVVSTEAKPEHYSDLYRQLHDEDPEPSEPNKRKS